MKNQVTQFSRYGTVDTTKFLSSYFTTSDMHRFAFMWLVYSGNKFYSVGPNISEKFVLALGGFKLNVAVLA